MSGHDRFDALAGAVALGEASPQERVTFDAHAAGCAACRDDAAGATFVTAQIAQAHRSETWRPSQPILERIRARRSGRARFTFGALGSAIALSLVLNIALADGLGTRLAGAFMPRADMPVASSPLSLDAPHRAVATPQPWRRPVVAYHATVLARRPHAIAHPAAVVPAKPAVRPRPEKLPSLDDMPDVLAGLDLYGTGSSHHHVAIETLPRCAPPAQADAGAVADVRPCRDATGRIDR